MEAHGSVLLWWRMLRVQGQARRRCVVQRQSRFAARPGYGERRIVEGLPDPDAFSWAVILSRKSPALRLPRAA